MSGKSRLAVGDAVLPRLVFTVVSALAVAEPLDTMVNDHFSSAC